MPLESEWRTVIAVLAVLVGIAGNLDYFLAICRRKTKPHAFSWLIWGLITAIAGVAQALEGAGAGNWVMVYTALVCFLFAALAWRRGEQNITRGDWLCLSLSCLAIIFWLATGDALWSIIWVCIIDALGFYPTMRKSWRQPRQEQMRPYLLANLKFFLGLMALETYTVTTMLYSIFILFINFAFVGLLWFRRRHYGPVRS